MMTDTQARIYDDWKFCQGSPDEFMVQGRVSHTAIIRTVVAMNPAATLSDVQEALGGLGLAPATIAKQFGITRRLWAKLEALETL